MVLAAGLGTRLRPLTYKTPKPMLKVAGEPVIDHVLKLLKRAGVKEVVINLHHLGRQIKEHVGSGKRYGIRVLYSFEPKILGTGGGIKKAERFLRNAPFIVMNGDVLIDIDLRKVVAAYNRTRPAALMVVRRLKDGEDYSRLDISKSGRLKGFGSGKWMFTGVQVLSPSIFRYLRKPSCLIENGYKRLLAEHLPVHTYLHKGYWNDIGTLERYYLGILFSKKKKLKRIC